MSILIENQSGNEVEVFIKISGGFVDAIVRADTKEDFETAAIARKLMVQETLEDGVTTRNVPAEGINIDALGPVVITPAVLDVDGNVTTPAVMDNRYHANIRIEEPAISAKTDGFENWKQTAIDWTTYGTPDTSVNAQESGLKLANVVLIDPDTINSPSRVWA